MFDVEIIRSGFPSLSRTIDGNPVSYLDGPGGTQVHRSAIDAMARFMQAGGSNLHGPFASSVETDEVVESARAGVADLFGASRAEIVFGQNMTSLTYALSRALARTWRSGDNIVLTRLDHDANVSPWIQAADEVGVSVRFVAFDPDNGCDLDLGSLDIALDNRTRLVAFTHASNALGTITPVVDIIERAHGVGALTYLDAVHYAPHGLVDVRATGTDFLVASAYKWFGPHTGCLYGRANLLASIEPYKLRPAPQEAPDRWETGTQSFESLAGVTAAVDYIASLGSGSSRREQIVAAYKAVAFHEAALSNRFLAGITELASVTLHGHTTSEHRTPTFAIDVKDVDPAFVAASLGRQGLFVWSGDYYAYEVMRSLGYPRNGLVRIGFVHYNTLDEVDRVLEAIAALT